MQQRGSRRRDRSGRDSVANDGTNPDRSRPGRANLGRTSLRRTSVPGQLPPWRRLLRRHRRLVAGALTALAVLSALSALRPPAPQTALVLVARHAAAAGAVLTADDVTLAQWPADLAPSAALTSPDALPGRPLVAPVTAGEVLLAHRFLAPSVLASYGAGLVATPVRLADAGAAALLRAGDVVDVLAATPTGAGTEQTAPARTVAAGVRVLLAAPDAADPLAAASIDAGSLVVLATTATDAASIAGAAATSRLSVVLRTL